MGISRPLLLTASMLAVSTPPAYAGPCTQDIAVVQAQLGIILQLQTAPQSTGAALHHQPTQKSIAAAEETLRGRYDTKAAAAALARAREADQADNTAACVAALVDAQRALAIDPARWVGNTASGQP